MMRQLLNANLQSLLTDSSVALSFSGGTDSTCLLFSLLELGYRPALYTYTVQGCDSEDLQRARLMSKHYALPLVVCEIPASLDTVLADVRRMLRDGVRGKVAIQCLHGHYYVAPAVREAVIVNGSGVDGLYGVYRDMAIAAKGKPKAVFDAARREHLANSNDDAMLDQKACYGRHRVRVVYPYRQPNVIDYLMGFTWKQINRPKLKWITIQDYQQEFAQFPHYFRPRGSQQIVAGTRELHEMLLHSPANRYGRKRVADVYRDIAREEGLAA